MKKNIQSQQNGSVIIYSILMLIVVTSVSISLMNIFIPKIRIVRDSINSATSIYAADTAAELCLYEARKQPALAVPRNTPNGAPAGYRTILTNNSGFYIASLSATPVNRTDDCRPMGGAGGANPFTFRATGYFAGVTRSLEISQ